MLDSVEASCRQGEAVGVPTRPSFDFEFTACCAFCASEECAESLETKKDTEPMWQRLSSQEIVATYWKYIRSDNANFG